MIKFFRHHDMNKKAMTMVEVLLVVALFSTLSIAVFQTFSNGLKIWDYGTASFKEEDVSLFLDKISNDLRNSVLFSTIPFRGDSKGIEWASLVMLNADPKSSEQRPHTRQIGKVMYFFDKSKGKIFRVQANYGQTLKGKYQTPRVLVSNVEALMFRYFYRQGKELLVVSSAKNILPAMIEVSVRYRTDNDIRKMVKRIDVPVGL
ncbi:MAG: hypothetical protein P9M12_04240 [Candidatus Aceula lacicola]|nr:hypothetical protein [Candidatus Aceula lacicola]